MWICPKCERPLAHANQWHDCVKQDLDALFEGRPPELLLAFDQLLVTVADWPEVAVSATSNCVVFLHKKTFLVVRPMKKELDIKFYLAEPKPGFPVIKTAGERTKTAHHVRVRQPEDLTSAVYRLLRSSWEQF